MNQTGIGKVRMVYLIGVIAPKVTLLGRMAYFNAQTLLEQHGFNVCNPFEGFKGNERITDDFFRTNLKKMMGCDAVYVLSDVPLGKGECTELKIALDLNLTIIQQLFHTRDTTPKTPDS